MTRNTIRGLIGIPLFLASSVGAAQDWVPAGSGYAPMGQSAPTTSQFNRQVVPGPPMQPKDSSRPASWPGQASTDATPWVPPNQRGAALAAPAAPTMGQPVAQAGMPAAQTQPNAGPTTGEVKPCDGTRIIARVGLEAIFESDAIGAVNEILEANKERIPASQLERQRELLIQQRLKGLIETKLIFLDARRTIPEEGWKHVEKQIGSYFDDNELDKMMKKSGVATQQEFDQKLRVYGTSLEQEKRAFIERSLAQQWVQQQIKKDEEITYDQMVAFYREHLKEFTTPARTEWEELMVRYSKYPTKTAAFDAIARMGNQVFGGAPLGEVAKRGSDGLTSNNGGHWDWTSKGSLMSQAIDDALFQLPVGQLSPIIADDKGYHIIRVIRREDEVVQPFLEAQVEIKKKIVEDRNQKQFREYLGELQRKTPVWTIYDGTDGTLHLANPQMPTRR